MDVYQIVTDRIIALIESGTIPWRKSWSAGNGMPKNLASKKEYPRPQKNFRGWR